MSADPQVALEEKQPLQQHYHQQQHNSSDLHVVTENGEQCFMWRANQLSYIAQDRQELPIVLATRFGPVATKLDLSYNSLTSFRNINLFSNLSELILDNNNLDDDHLDFKPNLRLKTLSMNKNKLRDLYRLVNSIKLCFPNLEYLSLIGNPLCPTLSATHTNESSIYNANINQRLQSDGSLNRSSQCSTTSVVVDGRHLFDLSNSSLQLDGKQTELSYQKYRYFIIYHLPNLRFLDSSPIDSLERDEALRRFYWMESPASRGDEQVHGHNSQCSAHNKGNIENNGQTITAPLPAATLDTNLSNSESQEDGFQLTIMTNYSDEGTENRSQVSQPSRGQLSVISNSRYTLRLRFKVRRD